MVDRGHLDDLHANGVHTHCTPLAAGQRRGDGTSRRCKYAGKVERFHGHDFDGPLFDACGCAELAA